LVQDVAAKELDIHATQLGRYERGESPIPIEVAEKMESIYHTAPGAIRVPPATLALPAGIPGEGDPFVEHVHLTMGRIIESAEHIQGFAGQIIAATDRQRNLGRDLSQRAQRVENSDNANGRRLEDWPENRVGMQIARARIKAKLTQAQLAEASGFRNEDMIGKIESGIVRNISAQHRKRIAQAVRVSESKLFSEDAE